jgi:hypothetical protein
MTALVIFPLGAMMTGCGDSDTPPTFAAEPTSTAEPTSAAKPTFSAVPNAPLEI